MNKGFKIYIGFAFCLLIALLIFVGCYMSNPLVKKGHIGMIEYIIICYKSLTSGGDDIHEIGNFAYCKSESEPNIEQYAISLYEKSAKAGYAPSQYKLGGLYLFKLNNEAKGIEWLNKAIEQKSNEARYLLGMYYMANGKDEEKGLELIKEADKNKYEKATKLFNRISFGIDNLQIEKALNKEKEELLSKKGRQGYEFSVF